MTCGRGFIVRNDAYIACRVDKLYKLAVEEEQAVKRKNAEVASEVDRLKAELQTVHQQKFDADRGRTLVQVQSSAASMKEFRS